MNQRVEKLEGILEKQQSFLNQFLQSLQEVKPSDENWDVTIKSLKRNLEDITFSKDMEIASEKSEDQKITSISSSDIQKELEDLKKKEVENQKIISSYDKKIENLQSNLSSLTNQLNKLTNQSNNLPLNINDDSFKPLNLDLDKIDTKTAINELKNVVNNHSTQISAILDLPVCSLPSDIDVKIHEFDTDLRSIKTMLRNQADIWSEFEATIQVLVQYKEEANETSGTEDHNGSNENYRRESPQSQSLQEQIRCLKYEVKKVRQEISAYSDQQESMSRDKGLDMPNRFNKINNQIGDLRKSINDSNNKIDALSEKVQPAILTERKEITVEKVSDSVSCIKHELKKIIQKVDVLFNSFEKIQTQFENLQSIQKDNNETINQLKQVFEPADETTQNNNSNNNNNSTDSPSLKMQFKQIVDQVHDANAKSNKNNEIIESLSQKINDIVKNIRILSTVKQPIKSLQESTENLKRDVEQMKQILLPQSPSSNKSEKDASIKERLIQVGDNSNPKLKEIAENIGKQDHQIQVVQDELKQIKENQQKIDEKFREITNQKHVVIDSNNNNITAINNSNTNSNSNLNLNANSSSSSNLNASSNPNNNNNGPTNNISSLLNARRERSNSGNSTGLNLLLSSGQSSSNALKSSERISLTGQSSSTQSRDHFFNFNRNKEGENNNSQETDADIDFDDLSPPSTPIIIKSTFESVDDITDAFKMVTHEQNRQKKVVEKLVDAIKQAEIKNSKLKYLDKMMQEMRNRSSEQGDMLLSIKTKQSAQEKTIQQLSKTARYMETLNISNELEAIKKHLKNSNYQPPSDVSSRYTNRSPVRSHASQPMQRVDDIKYSSTTEQKSKKTTKSGTTVSRNTHSKKDQK